MTPTRTPAIPPAAAWCCMVEAYAGGRIEDMRQAGDDITPSPHMILLGRIGIVALVSLIAAAGFALLLRANQAVEPRALRWATAAGLGLLIGFATRHGLRGHSRLLRGLVSLAALAMALEFLGVISAGDAGVRLAFPSRRIAPDWDGLIQLVLGGISGLLVLSASSWRATAAADPSSSRGEARTGQASRAPEGRRATVRSTGRPGTAIGARASTSSIGRSRTQTSSLSRRVRSWLRLPSVGRPKVLGGRGLRRWRHRVRIVGAQEDRCPYCLDVVERNDARGVVVCPVCHTRHHADCWAVTGMCQVPHYHR